MMSPRRFPKNKAPKSRKHTLSPTPDDGEERAPKVARVESTLSKKNNLNTKRRRKDGRAYVEKNSLTEAKLIEARDKAMAAGNLEEERRAANRLSSFQSRQRKKEIIRELESVVTDLSEHSNVQETTIKAQQGEILSLRAENSRLKDLSTRREKELASLKMKQKVLPTTINPLLQAQLLENLQGNNQLNQLLHLFQGRNLVNESESLRLADELLNLVSNRCPTTSFRDTASMMVNYDGPIATPTRRVTSAAQPTEAQVHALLRLAQESEPRTTLVPSPSSRRASIQSSNSSSSSVSSESTTLSFLRSESTTLSFLRSVGAGHRS